VIDGHGLRPPLCVIKKCGASTVSHLRKFIDMPIEEFMNQKIEFDDEKDGESDDVA